MSPFHNHGDKGIINQTFLFQHRQDAGSEQFGQRSYGKLWYDMEYAVPAKQTIGHNRVNVQMSFGIIAKSLNRHHRAADTIIKAKGRAEEGEQASAAQVAGRASSLRL